jgi:peptidyl-prolyl cis-trans isomerase C
LSFSNHQGGQPLEFCPPYFFKGNIMFRFCILFVTAVATLVPPSLAAQEKNPPSTAPGVTIIKSTADPCSDCDETAAPTVPPETVVLSIDGHSYTAAEFDRVVAGIVPPATTVSTSVRRKVAGILSEMRLLSAEALRRGLDKEPRVQRALTLARDQALGQAVAYHIAQGILTNEARLNYEANKEGYEQIRARHILIRTPDSVVPVAEGKSPLTDEQAKARAKEVRERLLKGEDFAKLAAALSDDLSASRGGELPRFRRMQMSSPEFENAAFKLRAGEFSEPVKTAFGYHIINVLERRSAPFDEVKAEIAMRLERDIFGKFLEELKHAHPAKLNESYFGPAEQPEPPAVSFLMRR